MDVTGACSGPRMCGGERSTPSSGPQMSLCSNAFQLAGTQLSLSLTCFPLDKTRCLGCFVFPINSAVLHPCSMSWPLPACIIRKMTFRDPSLGSSEVKEKSARANMGCKWCVVPAM